MVGGESSGGMNELFREGVKSLRIHEDSLVRSN